jgi:hypothetical protein
MKTIRIGKYSLIALFAFPIHDLAYISTSLHKTALSDDFTSAQAVVLGSDSEHDSLFVRVSQRKPVSSLSILVQCRARLQAAALIESKKR